MEIVKIIKDSTLIEGKDKLTITPDTDPKSIVHVHPTKLVETKRVNFGGWFVDMELLLEDEEHIDQDYYVLVETKSRGLQPFRMHNKEVGKRRIKVRARHVMFDSELYVVEPFEVEDNSTQQVLERLNNNLDRRSPFTFISTHTNKITNEFEASSLLEALEYLVNDKGAKVEANWYNMAFRDDLGQDKGVTVSYGKDLEDIRGFEEWDHVVTKLYPIGDNEITLPEKYIESDVKYKREYTKVENFSLDMGDKGEDEEWTEKEKQDKLRKLAKSYVTKNKYPKVAYQVTSNIKEDIDLWDTVTVKHPSLTHNLPLEGEITQEDVDKLGIPIKVLSYEYDVIAERTLKLEYGDFSVRVDTAFDKKLDDIQKEMDKKAGTLEQRLEEQSELINNWNKKGHMVILENEILFLDKLPMERAEHVLKIGLGGIAFSDKGVDGKFTSAWDLEGNFNTDFIGAGQIKTNHLASDVGSSLDISSNQSINLMAESIDSISVGGRNLARKSGEAKLSSSYRIAGYNLSEDWVVGETYTITVWGTINDGQRFGIWGNGSSSRVTVLDRITPRVHRSTFTLKTYPTVGGQNAGKAKMHIYNYPSSGASSAIIEAVKIEKGNKPTEWTPAPEDKADTDRVISYINVSPETIKIKSNKIQLEGYTTINGGFHVDTKGNMIAKSGKIANWNIDANIWSKNGSNYTTLKSGGNVAFAAGSPDHSNTTGSQFQIFHNGKMRARDAEIYGLFETRASGRLAIRIQNNRVRFYDWQGNRGLTGGIIVGKREGTSLDTMSIYHESDTLLSMLYRSRSSGDLITYMDFDTYNKTGLEKDYPVKLRSWTVVNGRLKSRNGLVVSGSKNAVQDTEHYGERLINAYETAGYYFGDLGFGKINDGGECLIDIEDVFSEVINTNVKYHVFTQAYNGKIDTIERNPRYFVVKGEPGTEFSWELKAKRLGFEHHRLETPDAPLERGPEEEERGSVLESELRRDLAEELLKKEEN